MTCDLHIHSNFSDGTMTPAELIVLAEKQNISAVALCDHNTVNGLPDFIKAAENRKVIAVNGIEISTEYNGTDLHILGLFLPEEMIKAPRLIPWCFAISESATGKCACPCISFDSKGA